MEPYQYWNAAFDLLENALNKGLRASHGPVKPYKWHEDHRFPEIGRKLIAEHPEWLANGNPPVKFISTENTNLIGKWFKMNGKYYIYVEFESEY